jgi:hypothetical protein
MLEAFHSNKSADLWSSLAAKLNSYAKESRLVQRISKQFSPQAFLLSQLEAVSTGRASLNQLVASIGHDAECLKISPQALQQRITRTECGVEGFLARCLSHICQWRFLNTRPAGTSRFGRIVIEDSTFIRFPKGNAEEFPGHGNASGPTAGCKVDLAFDLLGGELIRNELHLGTEQDKTIGADLMDDLLPSDLVLRDMGYFGVDNFQLIEALNAFWLSRLPLTADVVTAGGVALEKVLESHCGNTIDIAVKLTAKEHPARLVAIRASQQETEKRRREHRADARKNGRSPTKKALIRDGWHLMVTNVAKTVQSAVDLAGIYSQRWLIEIVFRAWKQAGNLSKALNRDTSPQHLKGLVLAGMIALAVSLKIGISLARRHPEHRYSLEKIFDYIISRLVALKKLTDITQFKPDPRHLQGQKRSRNSLNCQLLELLG